MLCKLNRFRWPDLIPAGVVFVFASCRAVSEVEHASEFPAAPRAHFNIVSPRLTLTVTPSTTTLIRKPASAASAHATAARSERDQSFPFWWRHHWDLWDFQLSSNSLWYGFDENASKAIEQAYLEGKQAIEFESFGSIDFTKNSLLDKSVPSVPVSKPIRRRDPSDFDTIYEYKSVRPSIAHDSLGRFLYVLSPEYGVAKIGTGAHGTVTGKIYAQNRTLAIHAGGHLALTHPTGVNGSGSVLLIRTPLLGPYTLLRVNPNSLLVITDSEEGEYSRIQLEVSDEKDVSLKLPALNGDGTAGGDSKSDEKSASLQEKLKSMDVHTCGHVIHFSPSSVVRCLVVVQMWYIIRWSTLIFGRMNWIDRKIQRIREQSLRLIWSPAISLTVKIRSINGVLHVC